MPRPLHDLPINRGIFFVVVFAAVFAVASVVSFLCASRKNSKMKRESGERRVLATSPSSPSDRKLVSSGSFNNIGISKAPAMAKLISWKNGAGGGEEEAVWKKTILMGEKCRQLDFSGRIMYDSEGNQLPELLLQKSPEHGGGGGGALGSVQ